VCVFEAIWQKGPVELSCRSYDGGDCIKSLINKLGVRQRGKAGCGIWTGWIGALVVQVFGVSSVFPTLLYQVVYEVAKLGVCGSGLILDSRFCGAWDEVGCGVSGHTVVQVYRSSR